VKAWREMQRRRRPFGGLDEEPSPGASRGSGADEAGDREGEPGGGGVSELADPTSSSGEGGEEDADEGFTMSMMLQSLNVDTGLLGYDKSEDRWID